MNSKIGPYYPIPPPNKPVQLQASDRLELKHEDGLVKGKGSAQLHFLPNPHLHIDVDIDRTEGNPLPLASSAKLVFNPKCEPIDVTVLSSVTIRDNQEGHRVSERNITDIHLMRSPIDLVRSGRPSRVIFHLLNYPLLRDSYYGFEVDTKEWKISLSPIRITLKHYDHFKETGGYAFTHAGELTRRDGQPFRVDHAKLVLEALRYLLSFSVGRWVTPALPVGLDKSKKAVWIQWGAKRPHRFEGSRPGLVLSTWFDESANSLLKLIPPLIENLQEKEWKANVENIIRRYVTSNSQYAGVDGGVILVQSALELLSEMFLHKGYMAISQGGLDGLSVADQIRLILDKCNVSSVLPPKATELRKRARSMQAKSGTKPDGPEVLTTLRNRFVHPEDHALKKGRAPNEIHKLGLSYVELALLFLLGYEGKYRKRFGALNPGLVPWTTDQ